MEANSRAGSLTLISMEDKGLPRDGREITGAIHREDELDLETTQQDSGGLARADSAAGWLSDLPTPGPKEFEAPPACPSPTF